MTAPDLSPAEYVAQLPPGEYEAWVRDKTGIELRLLRHSWDFWARPKQRTPKGDWYYWLLRSGRGFGKTRTGAEWIREKAEENEDPSLHFALVGRTAADVRDVMVKRLLTVFPPDRTPHYEPSKRLVTLYTGATATTYSADKPEQLKGPEHHYAWCDELAWWKYAADAWMNIVMGLRMGRHPQAVITTTPRPTKTVKEIFKDADTINTVGSTYENAANLPAPILRKLREKYEGTRIGRQELRGEILEGHPGALWQLHQIDEHRVKKAPELETIVVAIDPSVTEDGNEAGIIAAGRGADGHGYVLDDRSLRGSPNEWASTAIDALHERQGDWLIAEVNNGGDLVETVIKTIDQDVPYRAVRASRGKRTRAEPVAAKYEQGKVHHVGSFPELEDQMCEWLPGMESPDRLDAMVWAMTELVLEDDIWIS